MPLLLLLSLVVVVVVVVAVAVEDSRLAGSPELDASSYVPVVAVCYNAGSMHSDGAWASLLLTALLMLMTLLLCNSC